MDILSSRVYCFRCKKSVEKTDTRYIGTVRKEERYECNSCLKRNKGSPWSIPLEDGPAKKLDLYCERCRYKFSSKALMCPYCNQADMLMRGNITVKDLL